MRSAACSSWTWSAWSRCRKGGGWNAPSLWSSIRSLNRRGSETPSGAACRSRQTSSAEPRLCGEDEQHYRCDHRPAATRRPCGTRATRSGAIAMASVRARCTASRGCVRRGRNCSHERAAIQRPLTVAATVVITAATMAIRRKGAPVSWHGDGGQCCGGGQSREDAAQAGGSVGSRPARRRRCISRQPVPRLSVNR